MAIDQWFGFKITWKQPFDERISCVFVVIKIKKTVTLDEELSLLCVSLTPRVPRGALTSFFFFSFSSFHWFFCYSRDGLRGKEETNRSVQRVINSLTFHRRQPKPTTSLAWKIAELPFRFWSQLNEMCPVQTLKNRLVWDGNTLCALKIEILFVQYYSWNLISTKETVEKIF